MQNSFLFLTWNDIRDRLVGTGEKSPLGTLMTVPFHKAARFSQRWNSFENKNVAELAGFLSHAARCYLTV